MKLPQAKREAAAIAAEGVAMVVTFNPYDEETFEDRDGGYGYCPAEAFHIFERHEVVVERIEGKP